MKKKGFTLIELITSFALASVIMVFIFSIVVILKNNYISKSVRTNLTIKQSLLSQKINEDFKDNNVIGISTCDNVDKCFEFEFIDNTKKQLIISSDGKTIKYGDYTYKLDSSSYTDKITVKIEKNDVDKKTINDSLLTIQLPIYNNKYKELNFGINAIYQFNSNIKDLSIVVNPDISPDTNEWGDLADETEVVPNLFTYQILDPTKKTAKITGINMDYTNDLIIVKDGHYESKGYCSDIDPVNYCHTADCYAYDPDSGNLLCSSASYYNAEADYLIKMVVPAYVKLDSSGHYDPDNGTLYKITRFTINNGDFVLGGVDTLVFPDTIEYIDEDDSNHAFHSARGFGMFHSLSTLKLPKNLKALPKMQMDDSVIDLDVYIPNSITSIPSESFGTGSFFGGKLKVHVPSSVTLIADDAFISTHYYLEVYFDDPSKLTLGEDFINYNNYETYFYVKNATDAEILCNKFSGEWDSQLSYCYDIPFAYSLDIYIDPSKF